MENMVGDIYAFSDVPIYSVQFRYEGENKRLQVGQHEIQAIAQLSLNENVTKNIMQTTADDEAEDNSINSAISTQTTL